MKLPSSSSSSSSSSSYIIYNNIIYIFYYDNILNIYINFQETQFSSPTGLPSARYHLWAIPTRKSIIYLLLYIDLKQVISLRDPEEEEEEKEEKPKSPVGSTCVKQHVSERHNNNVASYLLESSFFNS